MSQHRIERTKKLDRNKEKAGAEPEAAGKREEDFKQEKIDKQKNGG